MKRFLVLILLLLGSLSAQNDNNAPVHEFILGGISVKPGSDVTVNINLPHLYNTPTKLSVRVIRGIEDGPTMFVTAAIHGDELNGIEIIRRLRNLKVMNQLKGTLILVPTVNVYGVMNRSRYLPDRRDLNRYFPGMDEGSLTSRIAKIIYDEIVLKSDLGIDIHTASHHRTNLPQIRGMIDNNETLQLARAFGAPVVLHSQTIDGSIRGIGQQRGIPVLLYETGEALRFDEQGIRTGVKGIVNVLQYKGMLPKIVWKKSSKAPIVLRSSNWLRAPKSGILRTIKSLGETVKEGETIAYIYEPLMDKNVPVTSKFEGIIIGKLEIPLVQEGDALFHIASFKNLNIAEQRIENYYEDNIKASEMYELDEDEMLD